MRRPTIKDLAEKAGVSISTVNRVINDAGSVREPTRERVLHAAEDIGFYGIGSIKHAIRSHRETHRLGILLQQGGRAFYRGLGNALQQAAEDHTDGRVELTLEFMDDLSPDNVARRLESLGETCESVALVAAACVAHGVPFCTQVGHTGPLRGSEYGRPIPHLDNVALDFPELTIIDKTAGISRTPGTNIRS